MPKPDSDADVIEQMLEIVMQYNDLHMKDVDVLLAEPERNLRGSTTGLAKKRAKLPAGIVYCFSQKVSRVVFVYNFTLN